MGKISEAITGRRSKDTVEFQECKKFFQFFLSEKRRNVFGNIFTQSFVYIANEHDKPILKIFSKRERVKIEKITIIIIIIIIRGRIRIFLLQQLCNNNIKSQ